jgi:D-3-phosphoglycerate dehydrogenase
MKIAVLDDYPDAFRQLGFHERLAPHEVVVYRDTEQDPVKLAERLADADAVVLTQARSAFPSAVIERLPKLKLVSLTGRNARHVDVEACTRQGIAVAARGKGDPHGPAELAWGLILSSLRNLPEEVARTKAGRWQGSVGHGVFGKTLGIYAYGRIGSIVAAVGRAFGMRVVCWGREGSTARAREAGFEVAPDRETFFAESDVLSLHLPMNESTRGIVTARDLALMKPTALIVNVSRARLIEEGALVSALRAGTPGFAAVDVYEHEPVLDPADPLISMPNVTGTPHLGYVEWSTLRSYYGAAVENILAFAAGKPTNILNADALDVKR